MAEVEPWYAVCSGSSLMQGDILPACVVHQWQIEDMSDGNIRSRPIATDTIILTQSCDLGNDGKTDFVLVAELINYDELAKVQASATKKDWKDAISRARVSRLLLMPPYQGDPPLTWSIVDFSRLYTMPISILREHASSLGDRLRLQSPYREYLSQAFAVYFMRVGLPGDLKHFKDYVPPVA